MPARVVDASVMAAWCFREPRHDEAFGLLNGHELVAPPLMAYELTSIARRKITTYPDKSEVLKTALRTALAVPIQWEDIDHEEVLGLALHSGLSTYDACYLYLAQTLELPLITFDRQLEQAAKQI
jgi:predicted nucleic acid-binding protein